MMAEKLQGYSVEEVLVVMTFDTLKTGLTALKLSIDGHRIDLTKKLLAYFLDPPENKNTEQLRREFLHQYKKNELRTMLTELGNTRHRASWKKTALVRELNGYGAAAFFVCLQSQSPTSGLGKQQLPSTAVIRVRLDQLWQDFGGERKEIPEHLQVHCDDIIEYFRHDLFEA